MTDSPSPLPDIAKLEALVADYEPPKWGADPTISLCVVQKHQLHSLLARCKAAEERADTAQRHMAFARNNENATIAENHRLRVERVTANAAGVAEGLEIAAKIAESCPVLGRRWRSSIATAIRAEIKP